jgi:hypothetical protein
MVQDFKNSTEVTEARQTTTTTTTTTTHTTTAEGVSTMIRVPTEDMELPTGPASTMQTKQCQIVSMELNYNNYVL